MPALPTHPCPPLRKTLVGAACLSLQPLALNALSVPVMAYIIHRLGPEGYGQWMVATAILAVSATLSSLGLRGAFIRAVAADPASAPSALAELLGLRLLLTALAGALAVLACRLLGYPAPVLWCAVVGAASLSVTAVATTLGDLLVSMHRARTLAGVSMAAGLALTGVSAAAAWWDAAPVTIALAYATGPALSALLLVMIVRRHICPVTVRWDLRRFAGLLAASRFFAAQQLLAGASAQAESLMLPRLIGIGHFGSFSAGAMPASRLTALPDGLCTAAYPSMVRACAKGAPGGARHVLAFLLIAAAGGTAIALAGMLAAEPLARILFPQRWELLAMVMRVTIWSLPLVAIDSVMGYALNAAGKDAAQARVSVPAAAASLVGSIALVATLGLMGACWAMLLRPAIRAAFLTPVMLRTFRPASASPRDTSSLTPVMPPPHHAAVALRKAG